MRLPYYTLLLSYIIGQLGHRHAYLLCRVTVTDGYSILGFTFQTVEVDDNTVRRPCLLYTSDAWDIEYDYPTLGFDELEGIHDRTDYDLSQHMKFSGVDLQYQDPATNEKYIPWILETSVGLGRMFLAVISDAYYVENIGEGQTRTVLKLKPELAPVKVAVSPLLKNKPELVAKAREVYDMLKKEFGAVMWDDNGNIGKRYRRQDEIGTPYCVVIDFDTLEGDTKDTVTIRDRDTTEQKRVKIEDLTSVVK